jgi:hypothetical protein
MRKFSAIIQEHWKLETEMVRKLADAIYPVLIPFEEQDTAIQTENRKQIEAIAYQAWRSFFRGRVGDEAPEADLEAARATLRDCIEIAGSDCEHEACKAIIERASAVVQLAD